MNRFTILGLCLISLISCQGIDPGKIQFDEIVPIALTRSQSEVLENGNEFAFDFFRGMVKACPDENVFVSPYGLQAGLSMLANGAEDETYQEIVRALGWDDYSIADVNQLYQTLLSGFKTVDKSVSFSVANSAWIKDGIPVKPDFVQSLSKNYLAYTDHLNLSRINKWCSDATEGKITTILDRIDPDTFLIMVNALYFKGIWSMAFNPALTGDRDFFSANGPEKIRFMQREEGMSYSLLTKDLQFCELLFGNGGYVIDFLMPTDGRGIDAFVNELTPDSWNQMLESRQADPINIVIPKFDQSFTGSSEIVIPLLQEMGIKRAFDRSQAQLGGICSAGEVWVQEVLQKTMFSMNETGAEAASATAVEVGLVMAPPAPRQMLFNQPFLYVIRETTTGAILFMGVFRG